LPPFFEDFPPDARLDGSAAGVGLPLSIFSWTCLLEGALIPFLPLVEDSFWSGMIISFMFRSRLLTKAVCCLLLAAFLRTAFT